MSHENPYDALPSAKSMAADNLGDDMRRVNVNPVELFKRGYALLGDQYWLFLGMSLVAIILGSLVLMMMCYVPIIFFLPISFASAFVLYRDIYAQPIVDTQIA